MNKKITSIFLLAILLLQSCVAYYDTSVSLREAYANHGRVKLTTVHGNDIEFSNIDFRDSVYYGAYGKTHGETLLDSAQISAIYLQDIQKSKKRTTITWLSIGLGIPVIIIVATIIDINKNGIGN